MISSDESSASIVTGNAYDGPDERRGWFIGSFIPPQEGLYHQDAVEIKWGRHPAGDERAEWVTGETRTTLAILISGRFELVFRERVAVMSRPGDYVLWGKGVDHTWKVLADSVVMTVRWPSV